MNSVTEPPHECAQPALAPGRPPPAHWTGLHAHHDTSACKHQLAYRDAELAPVQAPAAVRIEDLPACAAVVSSKKVRSGERVGEHDPHMRRGRMRERSTVRRVTVSRRGSAVVRRLHRRAVRK